jgi:lysophospholipase L1-like esterase
MGIHIAGFGACMIGGFPHRPEDSFFHRALERVWLSSGLDLTSSLVTLGGFPITRVSKHLEPKCLTARPDIVVMQFASCDLIVPLGKNRKSSSKSKSDSRPSGEHHLLKSTGPFHWVKWQLQGLIGDALALSPVTHPDLYLETLLQLVSTLSEHGVTPVVLSPFVFGGRRSDRFARDCAGRVQRALSKVPNATYVDAYSALDRHPRSRMLLADGTHLSAKGQHVVADALVPCLRKVVDRLAPLGEYSLPVKTDWEILVESYG